jgi:hypothetical protein
MTMLLYWSGPQRSGMLAILMDDSLQAPGIGLDLQMICELEKGRGHKAPPATVIKPLGAKVDPAGQNMGVSSVMKYAA